MGYMETAINNSQKIKSISGTTLVNIELCRVDSVNESTMTLDVTRLANTSRLMSVPFSTPSRSLDRGILTIPEVGAIGIMATTAKKEFFVIGFLSYANSDTIQESLFQGEILMQASGYGFLKLDNAGNVFLSSSSGNMIYQGENETYNYSTNLNSITNARDVVSGIINNVVQQIEKCYDKDISTIMSAEDLVTAIMNNSSIDMNIPNPVLEIQKGNVVENNQLVKLQVFDVPDAAYSLKVLQGSTTKLQILIGKDGSIQILANEIQLNCAKLDLTGVQTFTPNPFKYDGYEETFENN